MTPGAGSTRQTPDTSRVEVTYEIAVGDTVERIEIPFVVGVLADLGARLDQPQPKVRERRFRDIGPDDFDDVLQRIGPGLRFAVNQVDSGQSEISKLAVQLEFKRLADFEPAGVAAQVPLLAAALKVREGLANLRSSLYGNDRLEELLFENASRSDLLERIRRELTPTAGSIEPGLLDGIMREGFSSATEEERLFARESVEGFFHEVLSGGTIVSRDIDTVLAARIAALDSLLSRQLDQILHAAEFQKLEASWRGLHYLVTRTEVSSLVKIRILNISKRDLSMDFYRAPEFYQSHIFKKVCEEEYGTFGGASFGVLIGAYDWSRNREDISALESISNVAAAAHAPFISALSPEMFNLTDFRDLGSPRDLWKIFDSEAYRHWRCFRESERARYVGLVLPRILLRLPYGEETVPVEAFRYEESVTGGDHDRYLWGNPAFAFAARLTSAFHRYGWCAEIHGVEKGGLVTGLPVHRTQTDSGETVKCPTEVPIADRRQQELCNLGFIPLCYSKNSNYAAFFDAPSCHRLRNSPHDASATAPMGSRLEYVFAVSRFAHYIKAIMQTKAHAFKDMQECQEYLNNWISGYVWQAGATGESAAKYPLAQASVRVLNVPGKPYEAEVSLKPLFQLAELPAPLRTVMRLGQSSRRT
ncbi:MAG: type VI secretion system contractile sheath large subunit [Candidatus Solibacter sp.]|nr:type VI secretion system contractile sheath large subunit [Candidatus Solibacter sp.]